MSSQYEKKLKDIRKAEGYSQASFAELTGINVGTIKNYESGKREVGLSVIDRIIHLEQFKKYTMWLMTGDVAPEIGQISPALSPDGLESTSNPPKGRKAG